jgi:hypothetical protein
MKQANVLRPDSKGRITLGKLAQGVSGFHVEQDEEGRIILEPCVEIPAREKWLFDNPEAARQVKKGLQDAKAGKVRSMGSFAKYARDNED